MRQFYTAPTLLRSLMQAGDQWVKQHDRGSLRVLGTLGEPIGEHAWNWLGAPRALSPEPQPQTLASWFLP